MIFIASVTFSTNIKSLEELAPTNLAKFSVDVNSLLSISLLYHKSGLASISCKSSIRFFITCFGVAPYDPWLQNASPIREKLHSPRPDYYNDYKF